MNEDKEKLMEKAIQVMAQMKKSQEVMEEMAFDILNCSDMIQKSILKLTLCLEEAGILSESNKNQAVFHMKDCLEELSTYSENIGVCAHGNEEASAEHHDSVEELKQVLDFLTFLK
ncbi:MAG: hypothetical protein RR056_01440 [Acetivibrio sp.]